MKKKVIVLVGPTTVGKSALAVRLARILGGEIILADSRQVYRGIDLGSGKITKKEMKGVPHHLLNIVGLKTQFSVAQHKKLAERKIKEIIQRGRIPILSGGTGFYVEVITKNLILPPVPPDKKLRRTLEKEDMASLFSKLKKLGPERSQNIDPKNKIRLIRAIEIAKHLGGIPRLAAKPANYEFIKIGLQVPKPVLKKKIKLRLQRRIRSGMAIELLELKKSGVPWSRFYELGFDQKYTALYLQGKINNEEMLTKLFQKNWQYAKRQMSWFKRDKEIRWFSTREYKKMVKYLQERV